jgi:hypothetical protein
MGADFIKSRDEWVGKQRHTWYRFIPAMKEEFSFTENQVARAEHYA